MKKILFVTYIYPSRKAFGSIQLLTVGLLQGIIENGCQLDIVALIDKEEDITDIEKTFEFNKNIIKYIVVNYGQPLLGDIQNIFIDAYFQKYKEQFLNCINQKYDIMISFSSLTASINVCASLINQEIDCPYYQIYSDPLVLDSNPNSKFKGIKIAIRKILAKRMMAKADKIFFLGQPMSEYQKSLFHDMATKISYYDGCYLNIYQKDYYNYDNTTKLGYYGSYDPKVRNIIPLINAMKELKEYKLEVIGNGEINTITPDNVSIVNKRLTRQSIINKELNCGIYICLMNYSPYSIPGKLFYISATNIPILVIFENNEHIEMKKYLEQFKRFYFCKNTKKEIIKKIKEISQNNILNNSYAKICLSPGRIIEKIIQ